jgi:hypothetical protein
MRKAMIPAFLLLLGSMVLGATVLREPIASAGSLTAAVFVDNTSANPVPVREQNLDKNGFIRVHEQGVAAVNIAPATPITGGGSAANVAGDTIDSLGSVATAAALSIHMTGGIAELVILNGANAVARFWGPNQSGNDSIVVPLTRPIAFDSIHCIGPRSEFCSVSWVGAQP